MDEASEGNNAGTPCVTPTVSPAKEKADEQRSASREITRHRSEDTDASRDVDQLRTVSCDSGYGAESGVGDGAELETDSKSCAAAVDGSEAAPTTSDASAVPDMADAPLPGIGAKRRGAAKASGMAKKARVSTAMARDGRRFTSTTMPPPAPRVLALGESAVSGGVASEAAAGETSELEALRRELETLREQYGQQRKKLQASARTLNDSKQALCDVLVQVARRELSEEHDRVQSDTYRLGHCKQTHLGPNHQNTWSGGYDEEEINRTRHRIDDDRKSIAQERKRLENFKGDADDRLERREILNFRGSYLTREEQALKERETRLQVDRGRHLKRQQRVEAAVRSTFSGFHRMKEERYQLLNMIGRGGFSEVYKAFDLETSTYAAVKIHELGKDMSEAARQNYIRRAMREYEIQKGLKHPKVVTLQDCFPISNRAFGTVLELCSGDTLDEYMKNHGPCLPEKEARGIIIQVLSGLRYLNVNETGNKIIHYDLKPGNLFFQSGEVKIADFGLSKIVHQNNPGESIDLTSQGAGTYWYLPPECMVMEANQNEPPKISNKVDVWSTGVIFFELLFGRRPYGHGQSQEALRRAAMAGQAFDSVQLPATPKVSVECARYLKRLLALDKDSRPDVIEALADPYIRGVAKKPKQGGAPSEGDAGCLETSQAAST